MALSKARLEEIQYQAALGDNPPKVLRTELLEMVEEIFEGRRRQIRSLKTKAAWRKGAYKRDR